MFKNMPFKGQEDALLEARRACSQTLFITRWFIVGYISAFSRLFPPIVRALNANIYTGSLPSERCSSSTAFTANISRDTHSLCWQRPSWTPNSTKSLYEMCTQQHNIYRKVRSALSYLMWAELLWLIFNWISPWKLWSDANTLIVCTLPWLILFFLIRYIKRKWEEEGNASIGCFVHKHVDDRPTYHCSTTLLSLDITAIRQKQRDCVRRCPLSGNYCLWFLRYKYWFHTDRRGFRAFFIVKFIKANATELTRRNWIVLQPSKPS